MLGPGDLDTEIDNVFEVSPNLKIWPWRCPGWKKLDPKGLCTEIASVSEGPPNLEV